MTRHERTSFVCALSKIKRKNRLTFKAFANSFYKNDMTGSQKAAVICILLGRRSSQRLAMKYYPILCGDNLGAEDRVLLLDVITTFASGQITYFDQCKRIDESIKKLHDYNIETPLNKLSLASFLILSEVNASYNNYIDIENIRHKFLDKGDDLNSGKDFYYLPDNLNYTESLSVLEAFLLLKEDISLIKKVLDLGADVNAQNKDGVTPLQFAIQNQCNDLTLKALIAEGAV